MLVSVVIPLYNKEKYISETIRSVLDQTYDNFQIIIVDDGSTDKSVDEVEKFDDERIRIISQENAGVSAARNRGIKEARSDFIAFLDADDEWLPNHLEEIIELKDKFPTCDVFATNYKIVDSKSNERLPVNLTMLGIDGEKGVIKNYFLSGIKTAPPLCSSAIAVTKEAIENVGGFPVGVTLGEDLLTWAKLACQYKIAYSKKVTGIYNFRAAIELLSPRRAPDLSDIVGSELAALADTYENQYLRKYVALWHKMRLMTYIKLNDRTNALKELMKMIEHVKWEFNNLLLLGVILMPRIIRDKILLTRANSKKNKS